MAGFPASADAMDRRLGNRIAEFLCYPPSAERLAIDPAERDRLTSAPPISGAYRDIQGSEARAWFEILPDGSARCRVPANSAMSLYFCGSVTIRDGALVRDTMKLCELPDSR
ncbi:MAG: hypothetical protein ACMVO3_14410 [Thalassobaculum sp.]